MSNNAEQPRRENWLEFLYSPNGRIPRKRYWLEFVLPSMLIYIVASIVDGAMAVGGAAEYGAGPGSVLTGLAYLFFLWPSFAVIIKRLHDRGMTGWWSLIANGFIPFVVIVAAGAAFWYNTKRSGGGAPADPTAMAAFVIGIVVAILAWLFFFIQIGFVRGQVGPNAYGDDPLPTPEAVSSDKAVTIVFAVLTAVFLLLPLLAGAAYWYYASRTAEMREQTTIEETVPPPPSEEAPVEGTAPVEDSAPAEGTAPTDSAPPPDGETPAEPAPPQ